MNSKPLKDSPGRTLMKRYDTRNLKGDLSGGAVAGIIALPLALAFGVQSGLGAAAGLYGAIAVGVLAAALGGTATQASGPTGPMTVVSASIVAMGIARTGTIEAPEKLGAMRRYLEKSGQRKLPVTLDTQDWSFEPPWVAAQRAGDTPAQDSLAREYQSQLRLEVIDQERRGDRLLGRTTPQILLLHANAVGAAQWDALFSWLEATGHRFTTADEVLADSAFALPHEFVGRYGCGLWDRLLDARRRTAARAAIAEFLERSAAAWNRGDLNAFCSDYAEDALFKDSAPVRLGLPPHQKTPGHSRGS